MALELNLNIDEFKKNTFEYLLKASLRDKLIILLLSIIIPVAIFVGVYVYPFIEKNKMLDQTISQLTNEVNNLQAKQKEIEKIKAENKEMEIILDQAMQLLPQKGQIPEVLTEISNLGNDQNLRFMIFKPEAEVLKDFYAMIPISIRVEGQFNNIATFFSKVMMMSRIVNINEYKINVAPQQGRTQQFMLVADCKAATYRFLTPEEIKAQEAAKAAQKK